MSILRSTTDAVYKQLANVASMLGILPICVLFLDDGYRYLLPFIVYNNCLDDLDGVLAAKLNIRSQLGANLDNVCDAIAHTTIVLLVGMHYGGVCAAAGLVAATAIILRVVSRLDPAVVKGTGSPTNELVRHLFFVLILAEAISFNPVPFLIAAFVLHAVSMLVPYRIPYMIRSIAKSATAIGLVNVALVAAWLIPVTTPVIAAVFIGPYLYSFGTAGVAWLRS